MLHQNKRPFKVDVYFYYKCDCGAVRQLTFAEVKSIGKYLCDSCGQINVLETMTGVIVTPQYIGSGLVKQPTLNQPIKRIAPLQTDKDIIVGLKKIGFTVAQAKHSINSIRTAYPHCTDIDKIFELCVKEAYK